ncbi:MAG: enoyl-CoA hydratase [Ilumatobacteraceae bacterium]
MSPQVDPDDAVLIYTERERVAWLTLNRPERRNAINSALARAITDAMLRAEHSEDVDVVVLTGSGSAFCAGLDLVELGSSGGNMSPRGTADGPWTPGGGVWFPMTKPVIAAVNGVAVTGGLELVLHCDIVVAAHSARFGDTHARVGVFPGGGMIPLLQRAIGSRAALAMSLSGNFIDADAALRLGLAVAVVPDAELIEAAQRLARDIASADQVLVRGVLAAYHQTADIGGLGDALAAEGKAARLRHSNTDLGVVAQRRAQIIERGRSQKSGRDNEH